MKLNPPSETRVADVSFRGLMEVDEQRVAARKRDRHTSRGSTPEERLARAALRQLAEEGELADTFADGVNLHALPAAVRDALGCRSAQTLALDFEFETTARQAPRVGFYSRRGLEPAEITARVQSGTFERTELRRLNEVGYIYDPRVVTPAERLVIEREARRMRRALKIAGLSAVRVTVYTIEQFNRYVWLKYAEKAEHDGTVVGQNLPVDRRARSIRPT